MARVSPSSQPAYIVRAGTLDDIALLQDIEVAAGVRFRTVGLARVADHGPTDAEDLEDGVRDGLLAVAVDDRGAVGFLLAAPMDGHLHIAEIAVHPDHAGHRLAARMIDWVAAKVGPGGFKPLTLTTFRDVPWNAPYYTSLGFREIAAGALGANHEALRRIHARVFDRSARVFMIKD